MDSFEVYVDQVSHLKKLEKIFECLNKPWIILSAEKTKIRYLSEHLVGHIVWKEGINTDPENIEAMLEVPFPTIKHGV